jgi:hypothetical protein
MHVPAQIQEDHRESTTFSGIDGIVDYRARRFARYYILCRFAARKRFQLRRRALPFLENPAKGK